MSYFFQSIFALSANAASTPPTDEHVHEDGLDASPLLLGDTDAFASGISTIVAGVVDSLDSQDVISAPLDPAYMATASGVPQPRPSTIEGMVESAVEAAAGWQEQLQAFIFNNVSNLKNSFPIRQYRRADCPIAVLPQERSLETFKDAFNKSTILRTPQAVSQMHLASNAHLEIHQRLESFDGQGWISLRMTTTEDGDCQIEEDAVSTTSERKGENLENLSNVYVHISLKGHITISTTAIDTERKANQFIQAVIWAHQKRRSQSLPEKPLMICLHQLNSFGFEWPISIGEAALIRNQNKMAEYISQHLPSLCRSSGIDTLADPIIVHKNQSLNGFVTLFGGEISKCKEHNKCAFDAQKRWIDTLDNKDDVEMIARAIEEDKNSNGGPLSQMQRIALDLLLDHELGTITQINCRSSCDRTGIVRALAEVLQTLQLGTKEKIEFIKDFEQRVGAMDIAFGNADPSTFADWINCDGSEFKDIAEFQADIFAQLLAVGIPITGRSTGLEGLRWNHDSASIMPGYRNFHPLPYLPLVVFDEATSEHFSLVNYSPDGYMLYGWRNLTSDGIAVLIGNSSWRQG